MKGKDLKFHLEVEKANMKAIVVSLLFISALVVMCSADKGCPPSRNLGPGPDVPKECGTYCPNHDLVCIDFH